MMTSGVGLIGSGPEQTLLSPPGIGMGPTVMFPDGTAGVLADLKITAGTNAYDVCVRMYNAAISVRGCICTGAWNGIGMNGSGSGRLVDCLLVGNTNQGTWIGGTVEGALVNCTVADNAVAGGVLVGTGPVTLWNSIFWGNGDDLEIGGSTVVTASCCDVGDGDFAGSNGNLSAEPLFVAGPVHNYYLSHMAAGQGADSPCIDAGTTTAAVLGLDGRTTRTDGVGDAGVVDVGCHASVTIVITSIAHGSDDITIEWNAQPGVSYVVEWSDDRQTWTAVSVGATGTWTDTGVLAGHARRFYRVRAD
jgi:hypothetical protein